MSVESVELLRQENEKRILQSVKVLLNENNPSDISLRMIADKAGVVSKTINNIFGTKNSLLILTAISAYKEEHCMLDELVASSEFIEKTGLEQVMTLHYERAKFYRSHPYVASVIFEIERLRLTNEKEIKQCKQYLTLTENISSYYDDSIKKGQRDGSIKNNIDHEEIHSILFFSFGAVTQRLQSISQNEFINQQVDPYTTFRTVLKITKNYIRT